MKSFVERAITVVITAGPNSGVTFGANKSSTLTLAGYRVSAFIDIPGWMAATTAQISIYGMNLSDMNAVASVGNPFYAQNHNTVTVLAGDAENGYSAIFQGNMMEATVNTASAPRISLDIMAQNGYGAELTKIPPSSYGGAASVATIMADFATQMGYAFENGGVNSVLSNPYFPGTLGQQIKACARAADINFYVDDNNKMLAIWPKNGSRQLYTASTSPTTGMIGYPRYTNYGIDVDMLFNPALVYGGILNVQSSLKPANGGWSIYAMSHAIESITPNGDWITTASCFSPENWQAAIG